MSKILNFLIVFTMSLALASTVLNAKKRSSYKKSKSKKSKKKRTVKKVSKVKKSKSYKKKNYKKNKNNNKKKLIKVKNKKREIIHKRPKAAIVREAISIDIEILKNEDVSYVILNYSSSLLQEWDEKEMINKETKYFANIPEGFVLKGGVSYYIEAFDEFGEKVANYGSKELPMLIDTYIIKRAGGEIVLIAGKEVKKEEEASSSLMDELADFDLDSDIETVSSKVQKTKLAAAIVSVVTRSTILKSGAKTLIEVLRYLPGINVKILPSGNYSISIRGVAKDGNVLLLLNGNRVNNPYNSEAIYDIPTSFIEKVEVIRGPGSSLFGTDAVAGVINIFTTKKDRSLKAFLGIDGNYSVASNYSVNRKGLQIDLSGGVSSDDGANAIITRDSSYEEDWSLTYDNKKFKTDRWSKNAYLSARFSNEKLELFIFAMENKRGAWVGPNFTATQGTSYKSDIIVYDLNYSFVKSEKLDFKAKVYGNVLFTDNFLVTAPQGYSSTLSNDYFMRGKITKEKYNALTLTTELSLNWQVLKNLNLLTGLSYQYLKILNYDLTRNYSLLTEKYHANNFGNYDDNIDLVQDGKERSSVAYYLQSTYDYKDFGATLGLRFDHYDDFGLTINPRVGLVYNLFDILVLKALHGQAFRAPTIKEMYDQTDTSNTGVLGNESLDPENVKTSELGMELSVWKLNFSTNLFFNINENIIAPFDKDGGGAISKYENIGSTDDIGVEAEVKVLLNKYFNAFFNISWFQREFEWNAELWKEKVPDLSKRESILTNIPMRSINIAFNFNYKNLGIFLGVRNRSRALNNNRFDLEQVKILNIPEYWKLDFNISYSVSNNFLLYFAGTDIGKTHYSAPSDLGDSASVFGEDGLIQPSYTLRLGLIYRFNFEKE